LAARTAADYNAAVIPSSTRDLAPGVAFGSYVVHELIGRGGMAAVYRAEHLLLEKPVALKVMNPVLVVSSAARQRFLLEGRTAAAIKHPNVVDITDVGVYEGMPFLVMELLRGEDLEAYLRHRTLLDEATTIRLALPVVSALHAAHASGVVHRDIKPSNIFMSIGADDQIVPKVLDFGISKYSFDRSKQELQMTPQHQIMGTPRYLPPEALQGARELGPLSDQYSLGVVLYQCVTGTTPFSGDTLVSLLNSLSRGTFEPPRQLQPSISDGLDRVITRALSPEPADRFPTMRDMGRALLELAAERTQMVWGRSFGPPSNAHEIASHGGDGGNLLPALRSPALSTERLSSNPLARKRRWRMAVLGGCLVVLSGLGLALWQSFSRVESARANDPAVRQSAPATLPSPPDPSAETKPETKVMGLAPRSPDVAPLPVEREATQPRSRPRTSPSRMRSNSRQERAERSERAEEVKPPPASESPSTESVEPQREANPGTVRRAPRFGANRSPLLD
jgi:eukaryotic-like serine/threonine-protein kinase